MFTARWFRYVLLLFLLPGAWLFMPSQAHAQVYCQAVAPNISFGTVNPNVATQTSGQITTTCTNYYTTSEPVTLCYNIGNGPSGLNGSGQRQMTGGSGNLAFQLYSNGGESTVAGSIYSTPYNTPITQQFTVPAGRNGQPSSYNAPTVTVYASTIANQTSVAPGSYTSTYSGANSELTGAIGFVSCSNTGTDGVSEMTSFVVSGTVAAACTVTAGPTLNLGSVPASATNITGNNTVSVTCTATTPYYVGLAPLSTSSTTGAGTLKGTGTNTQTVPYQLRSTAGMTGTIWGNTATSTSVGNGVQGVGNGSAQSMTVYATVASADYTPDTYTDTVTVYVNY
jgi:spore coat protein U-like protein